MTVHGEMRIVPLSGSGGVFEGPAAVTVVWPWGLHAIRFIPWACVLFLALLAANRATGAWLALLPAAALQVISMLCEVFFPRATDVIDGLLLLALGLSLLWLMGAVLARRSIPEIVLGALCSLALPALLVAVGWMVPLTGAWSAETGPWDANTVVSRTLPVVLLALVMVAALAVARFLCRRRFTWPRFHGRLFAATMLAVLLPTLPLLLLVVLQFAVMDGLEDALAMLAMGGGVLAGGGAALYVLIALYLEIARRVPALRERFLTMMRLNRHEPDQTTPVSSWITPGETQEEKP